MIKRSLVLFGLLVALVSAAAMMGCRSAHVTSAILYIDLEQYQKAIDVINEGLYYSPEEAEAYFWLGEAYSRLALEGIDKNDYLLAKESFSSAYESYVRARELDPESMTEQVGEALEINYHNAVRDGQNMWRDQHYEEAEGFFRLAFAALPDSVDSIKSIATMKIQQAEMLFDEPDRAMELRMEALTLLDQVLVNHPEAYSLQVDKAYVLTQLDRVDEADALYKTLLRDHGDDPDLLLDVISLYNRQDRNLEAAELILKVADIYQNDTDPATDAQLKNLYSEAGFHLRQAGELERAIDAYNLASEQDVGDVTLLIERQQLLLLFAQELLQRSIRLGEAGDAAGAAELEAQAEATLQRGVNVGRAATDLAPTNADGFFFLATTLGLLGDEAGHNENMKTYQELSGVQ
jgi:tetratricopeptide (TPR) repeat protein